MSTFNVARVRRAVRLSQVSTRGRIGALTTACLLGSLALTACNSSPSTPAGSSAGSTDAAQKKDEGAGAAKTDGGGDKAEAGKDGGGAVATPGGGAGLAATSPLKVIPEGASVIVYADLGDAMKTPGFATGMLGGIGATNPEMQKQVMTLVECGVALEGIGSVSAGFDPMAQKGMIAIEATGIGKVDVVECAAKKLGGGASFELKDAADGGKELVLGGGDGVGLMLGDDMLVLASKEWADRVRTLAKGEGESAVDGSMKELTARAGMGPGLSFAAKIPASMAPSVPVPGVENVTGHFSTSADMQEVSLTLSVGTASEEASTAVTTILKEQYAAFKPALELYGVPKSLADRVAITQETSVTKVDLTITGPEILELMAAANALGGAAGGAPPSAMVATR